MLELVQRRFGGVGRARLLVLLLLLLCDVVHGQADIGLAHI